MEKLNLQCCQLLPNACQFGQAEPKQATTPEVKRQEITNNTIATNKPVQKPWSVFEGLYWI